MELDPTRFPSQVLELLRQGDRAAALSLAEKAVATYPDTAQSWLCLARAHLAAGHTAAAHAAAAAAAQRESIANEATLLYALLSQATGAAERAAALFEQVCNALPHAGVAWLGLGETRLALQQPAAAQLALARATGLLPTNARAWRCLAGAALGNHDAATAADAATRARTLDAGDPDAGFLLALARARLGDLTAAHAALDAVLAEHPHHTPRHFCCVRP